MKYSQNGRDLLYILHVSFHLILQSQELNIGIISFKKQMQKLGIREV